MAQAEERGGVLLLRRSPVLGEFSKRFLDWVNNQSMLKQKSKDYYANGWRLLAETDIAGMRLDAISQDDTGVLRFPGGPSNHNNALRTLRRITLPLVMANLIAGSILTFSFAMLEVSDGLILAMRENYFPITKMIWQLMGRIDPDSAGVACTLGVVGMVILCASLLGAAKLLGNRMRLELRYHPPAPAGLGVRGRGGWAMMGVRCARGGLLVAVVLAAQQCK